MRTDQKGLCDGGVAHAADDRAAARGVVGQDTNQILEAARETLRAGVGGGIGVVHLAGGGGDDVLPGCTVIPVSVHS